MSKQTELREILDRAIIEAIGYGIAKANASNDISLTYNDKSYTKKSGTQALTQITKLVEGLIGEGEIEEIIKLKHIFIEGVMDEDVFVVVPFKILAQAIAQEIKERLI